MKLAPAATVLALALAAAGCGGGSSSGGGAQTSSQSSSSSAGSSAAGGAKTVKVSMKDISFKPKAATVPKGATVVWTNDDTVAHDVTKSGGPGPSFSSGTGNIQPGGSYKRTFTMPGKISYRCTVHPGMDASLTVK
jgi:plastocyanin